MGISRNSKKIRSGNFQYYLDSTQLGNATIGKDIDAFWLDNSLKINSFQQIDFLKKLINKNLPFSKQTFETGERIMTEIENDSVQLIAKTGLYLHKTKDSPDGGWYIGYVKKDKKPHLVFALNIKVTEKSHRNLRREIVHQILKELKIL